MTPSATEKDPRSGHARRCWAGARAERDVFVEGFRLFVALLGTGLGFAVGQRLSIAVDQPSQVAICGVLGCLVGYVLGGVGGRLTDRALSAVEREVQRVPASQVLAGGVGGAVGLLGGLTLAVPVSLYVQGLAGPLFGALVLWVCGALGMRVMVRRAEEL